MHKPILSPKNDYIFKLIFGDEKNVSILRNFLQAVLDIPEDEYGEVRIVNPYLTQNTPDDKFGILDVKLKLKSGKLIDIEIQLCDVPGMRERIIYYTQKCSLNKSRRVRTTETSKRRLA